MQLSHRWMSSRIAPFPISLQMYFGIIGLLFCLINCSLMKKKDNPEIFISNIDKKGVDLLNTVLEFTLCFNSFEVLEKLNENEKNIKSKIIVKQILLRSIRRRPILAMFCSLSCYHCRVAQIMR